MNPSYTNFRLSTITVAIIVAICVITFGTPAVAGDESDIADLDLQSLLDDVVLSASRHAETLEETPANVFIITSEMIRNYACQNIADALKLVPGLYITDDYSLTQIGVRGLSAFGDFNSHVLVLVNGRPTQEQYGGTSSITVSGVHIDNIDRIEVIKGPASSLYGSNAFLGIINLITKTPTENGITATSSYQSALESKSTSVDLYHEFASGLTVHSTGSFIDADGSDLYFEEFSDLSDGTVLSLDADGYHQYYLDSSSFTGGWARNFNTFKNYSTHSRLDWNNWSLTAHFSHSNTGIAHSLWGSLINRDENRFKETRHYVDLGHTQSLSERVDLSTRFSWNYYKWADQMIYNYSSWEVDPAYSPGPTWVDYEFNTSYTAEAKLDVRFSETDMLIIGGEIQLLNISHESGEADADAVVIDENVIPEESVKDDGQIYNLYGQHEHRFSDKLKVVGGLHFNYYSYTTGRVMPKGAIVAHPYDNSTYKFIVSRGFRSPSFYELAYTDTEYYAANPDLKPETITSYELISAHAFPYGMVVEVAGNYSEYNDLILQSMIDINDPTHPGGDFIDGTLQYRNVGEMRSTSLEFGIKTSPAYRLSGMVNMTYQKLEILDDEQDAKPVNSPKWLGNVGVMYQAIPEQLMISANINYVDSRITWDGSELGDVTLVDAAINAPRLLGWMDASLSVKNVFDTDNRVPLSWDYMPSSSIQRPGRSVNLKLGLSTNW